MIDYVRYLEVQNTAKVIECDDCKQEFELSAELIQVSEVRIREEVIQLTYFTCPHCNKLYTILIDNARTLELKEFYKHQAEVIQALTKRKKPTEKSVERANKYKRLLQKEYSYLNKTYNGVFYQKDEKETGNYDH